MKVIVITPPEEVNEEVGTVEELFKMGLEKLHLRKPGWSDEQLSEYIENISEKYYNRISIHQHAGLAMKYNLKGIHHKSNDLVDEVPLHWNGEISRSVHSLKELEEFGDRYQYFFLSPVFDSISKQGYSSNLDLEEIKLHLSKGRNYKVIALGGIDQNRIAKCKSIGFNGIAVLGTIWQKDKPEDRLKAFEIILKSI